MTWKWSIGVAVATLLLVGGVAFAQMGWGPMGPGMGWGQMGPGAMGPGMGGGWHGGQGCPATTGGPGGTPITEEKAKELAQQYADKYLTGFSVERVLPFTGMGMMTMYQAELKGPNSEARVLHVNPWGYVMPFGGPWRRG